MTESIGARLQTAREKRRVSLAEVSQATKVRQHYLQALERDEYASMPSMAQARGFLRLYAEFLGLDSQALSEELLAASQPAVPEPIEPAPAAQPTSALFDSLRSIFRRKPAPPPAEPATQVEPAAQAAEHIAAERVASAVMAPEVSGIAAPAGTPLAKAKKKDFSLTRRETAGAIPAQASPVVPAATPVANPAPTQPVESAPEASAVIFRAVGTILRERRELLSITPEELERHTRVRVPLIRDLEAGAAERWPSPVHTRGLILRLAGFLELDTDAVLLRFAEGLQARHREQQAVPPAPVMGPIPAAIRPLRAYIAGDLVFVGGIALLLFAFAIWGVTRSFTPSPFEAMPTVGVSIPEVLNRTPTPFASSGASATEIAVTGTPENGGLPAIVLPTMGADMKVQVIIRSLVTTFMRVTVDGKVQFTGRTAEGQTYTYEGASAIEVLTGSGGALQITHNGIALGTMGRFAEVVDRIYTATAVQTPTPTAQPTGSPVSTMRTPKPSATPTP